MNSIINDYNTACIFSTLATKNGWLLSSCTNKPSFYRKFTYRGDVERIVGNCYSFYRLDDQKLRNTL